MVDEKKRMRNSKLIGLAIGVIAVVMFALSLYMGAGMQ
jgi:predicted nucleic acid-binding Zn ribbon protein